MWTNIRFFEDFQRRISNTRTRLSKNEWGLGKFFERNLRPSALLIEPNNEEVILMLMKIALKKSNYSKVKDLSQTFVQVCKKLCDENDEIQESLKNLEPKNES